LENEKKAQLIRFERFLREVDVIDIQTTYAEGISLRRRHRKVTAAQTRATFDVEIARAFSLRLFIQSEMDV